MILGKLSNVWQAWKIKSIIKDYKERPISKFDFFPTFLISNHPWKNKFSSCNIFTSPASVWVISCICDGRTYTRNFMLPCPHLSYFMKVVCHKKGWGGTGAEVSGLVLIICKSMSGTDLEQNLLSGWAKHLCSHMTTTHRKKTLHPAEPQILSHEMEIENLPLLLT